MKVYAEELTPEEMALLRQRDVLRCQLRRESKEANEDKAVCAYCKDELTQKETRLSHLVPPSQGGQTDSGNVVICCAACANSKHGRTLQEWAERLNDQLDGVHDLITKQSRKAESAA